MKHKRILWILGIVVTIALAGCQQNDPAQAGEPSTASAPASTSGDLDNVSVLALGTLKLEGTENALTTTQAADLLPLWTIMQGGTLEGSAETDAVLKQIESRMTEAQLASIEAMALTREDQQAWMQERGIEMPAATGGQGGAGAQGDLSEDERAKMREEFQNMNDEERATRAAEMDIEQPEGVPAGRQKGAPEGGDPNAMPRGGQGLLDFLLGPLVDLLTERAAS